MVASVKPRTAQLFESFDAVDLNNLLKALMPGLSVKVFRTYNASVTLSRLLNEMRDCGDTVEERKASYDRANKQVSINVASIFIWTTAHSVCFIPKNLQTLLHVCHS